MQDTPGQEGQPDRPRERRPRAHGVLKLERLVAWSLGQLSERKEPAEEQPLSPSSIGAAPLKRNEVLRIYRPLTDWVRWPVSISQRARII